MSQPPQMSSKPAHSVPPQAQSLPAPVWLQRLSLFILVLFCIYLGGLVTILPWWPPMWDRNPLIFSHPQIASLVHNGVVKGVLSGLGLLDIWIGISELVHYKDFRG